MLTPSHLYLTNLKAINNIKFTATKLYQYCILFYQLMYNNNANITTPNTISPNTNAQSTTPKANSNLNIISLFEK